MIPGMGRPHWKYIHRKLCGMDIFSSRIHIPDIHSVEEEQHWSILQVRLRLSVYQSCSVFKSDPSQSYFFFFDAYLPPECPHPFDRKSFKPSFFQQIFKLLPFEAAEYRQFGIMLYHLRF
ncbi:hypothetical protein FGO68_gene2825 [Halteria grandinella]|uniref:Uncharacterized protein n=1 Tax=Halteria grandinella TaxID=5974 RepID=A0A8J8STX5_HALGN|nr:hypothetical protein FGO68_gene2825 [Halteria grandinella]